MRVVTLLRVSFASFASSAVGAFVMLTAWLAACVTDYQKGLDDPNYGGPNALAGKEPPGPTLATSESDAASGSPLCVRAGGQLVADAGACDVSFSKDVLGAFSRATPTCTQPVCHGGPTPLNQPRVDTADGPGTWARFTQFQLDDKFYVNPCATDPTASGMLCNLLSADDPGACGVHMPQSGQLAADDLAIVEKWLKCGAPNN